MVGSRPTQNRMVVRHGGEVTGDVFSAHRMLAPVPFQGRKSGGSERAFRSLSATTAHVQRVVRGILLNLE